MRFFLPLILSVLLYPLVTLAQSDNSLKAQIKLYPNPVTSNSLYIDFGNWQNAFEHLEIYDLTGSKVMDVILNTDVRTTHRLDLSSLAYGNYFLIIKSKEEVFSTRITLRKK